MVISKWLYQIGYIKMVILKWLYQNGYIVHIGNNGCIFFNLVISTY